MAKVELTVKTSKCHGGYCKEGDVYFVEDVCPPICHELWDSIYPYVYVLLNDGSLDWGNDQAKAFEIKCPDEGRAVIYGEIWDKNNHIEPSI
jgi:uncharacterized repeat protein (TIGR04076 family)